MKLKMLFSAILTATVFTFAGFSINASAATGASAGYNFSKQQKQTWHFKTKAAAERKLRELQNKGHSATMFKNLRGWSVTTLGVDRGGGGGTSTTVTTTRKSGGDTTAIGAGCEKMLRGAEVFYFPTKDVAVDMYNAHLRQGDCAKMWNAGSKGWAIQVKAVPGAGARRGTVRTSKTPTTTITRTTTRTATSPSGIPSGANITYFPDRSTADAIYKAALRQGDWAKMWNAGSKGWAVAIKVR